MVVALAWCSLATGKDRENIAAFWVTITSMTQDQALDILKTGASVFLTGEPGSGKTHTVNRYTAWLRERGIEVAVTASTGIAATHIGGTTIHSWSGVGVRSELTKYDIEAMWRSKRSLRRISG